MAGRRGPDHTRIKRSLTDAINPNSRPRRRRPGVVRPPGVGDLAGPGAGIRRGAPPPLPAPPPPPGRPAPMPGAGPNSSGTSPAPSMPAAYPSAASLAVPAAGSMPGYGAGSSSPNGPSAPMASPGAGYGAGSSSPNGPSAPMASPGAGYGAAVVPRATPGQPGPEAVRTSYTGAGPYARYDFTSPPLIAPSSRSPSPNA